MHSPYGLELNAVVAIASYDQRATLCDFDADLVRSFETLKYQTIFQTARCFLLEGHISARRFHCFCTGRES